MSDDGLDEAAPDGAVWVCALCGRWCADRTTGLGGSAGWNEGGHSCHRRAVLSRDDAALIKAGDRVTAADRLETPPVFNGEE